MNRLGWCFLGIVIWLGGCAEPEFNPHPTTSESDSLSRPARLTFNFGRAGEGYFSRDLNWVIFQGVPNGQRESGMFVAQLRRGEPPAISTPIRVSPIGTRNRCGFFSPDGRSLIFATAPTVGAPAPANIPRVAAGENDRRFPPEMEIVRADGWSAAAAGLNPGDAVKLALHPLTRNDAYDGEGSYSPDGKWIVFTSFRTGDGDVYVMHPDGSHVVQITRAPGLDGDAFFSPDGKRLVYRSDRQRNGLYQIFVGTLAFDSAGEITQLAAEKQLTHDASVNWQPYWHPDGRHIVYATTRDGAANDELYVMRDDGSHKTRLTFSAGFDGLPAISADGKELMWTSTRTADRRAQLFIARFRLPPGA